MLSAQDLLVSLYDGGGTLRYNEAAQVPAPGAVAPGDQGVTQEAGVAVAPDGSYYVASTLTQQVLHYSNSGTYLGTLGENDADQVHFVEPGTLAFGPNGNLYVADLGAGAIYQFDTTSATQQWLDSPAYTTTLAVSAFNPGEIPFPGGFTFAANGDLIVGDLGDGSVATYHAGARTGYLIYPYTPVGPNDYDDTNDPILEPASILAENNGNLLISDLNLASGNDHHQVVLYTASTGTASTFLDFSNPATQAPVSGGLYSQPEALLLDQDGNLLIGVSPDHNSSGAILKYNINTGAYVSTVASGIGTPAGLAYIPSEQSNLLVSDYDDSSVLRYDNSTDAAVPGGVLAGSSGLAVPAGVAVAPDGTYYVSSSATAQVLHYNSAGLLLGALGANDADQVQFVEPGALAFGPNGNLYVADLGAGAIYQFDTTSATQQWLDSPAYTTTLAVSAFNPGEIPFPGGFTFAANGDLIVGDLGDGSVATYHAGARTGYLVYPYTPVGPNDYDDTNDPILEPASILAENNGDLLISDLNLASGNDHHQVVLYTASTGMTSTFLDFSNPATQAPVSGGLYSQPEALLLDQDGNLLVGVSPDHSHSGAVLKYDLSTGAYISTVVSGIGTPSGLALTRPTPIVTTSAGATGYTAGGAAVAVDSGLTLSDADTLPALSATVTISNNFHVGDTLHFTNTANITGSVSTIDGVYTLTLTGSDTLADYEAALKSVTFSSSSSSTDPRTISFTIIDGTQVSVAADKLVNVSAPVTITGLYVKGSAWTSGFLGFVAAHETGGSSTLGYLLQTGATQTTTLPWANINTIDIQFSGTVTGLTTGSLELIGGTGSGATAAPTITAVSSLGGNAYQVSLSGSLGNNKYVFAIASTGSSFSPAVTDANGAGISGTFTTGVSSFPSGNGLAGSTFDFFFNVLPGDGNQNALVNASDTSAAKAQVNFRTTTAGYNYLLDYNGAGFINANDVNIDNLHVNNRQNTITAPTAPSGAPVGGSGFTELALGVQESGSSSSGSSPSAVTNVIPASTTSPTSGGSGSAVSGDTSTSTSGDHGSNQFAATDEAVSDFDLADLWA